MTEFTVKFELDDLEKETVEKILNNEIEGGHKKHAMSFPTVAYAVWWNTTDKRIEHGRVRWGHKNNIPVDGEVYSSLNCSPFPGCWVMVPVNQLIRVTHYRAF